MAIPRIGYPTRLKRAYDWLDALNQMKVADQTVTASTVLVDDDTLKFAMEASKKYRFSMMVFFDTTAAGDFKFRHVGPASPTLVRIARQTIAPGDTVLSLLAVDTAFSGSDVAVATTSGTNGGVLWMDGIIHNGVNAGTFKFQFAQNTSDAGNTIVRAGSSISWSLIA